MVMQGLLPTMQHRDRADLGTKIAGIGSDAVQRLRRGVKQDGVDDRFVVERYFRNRSGYGEHDVEVGNWQQFGLACFEPLGACQTLTLRAMPITTGVVGATNESAIGAVFDMPTERRRPACLDRRHDAALGATQMMLVGVPVRWA